MSRVPVFHELRRRLQQLLRRRGQTREDAEDVIQDAFLRLQVYYRKGGEVRQPEAFLVRTALRLSINARRDAHRRSQAEHSVKGIPLLDPEPAAEDIVSAEQSLEAMTHGLNCISTTTRDVFLLHRVDGLSYAQIAKLHGMTTKAVERRIAKAMFAVFQETTHQETSHKAGQERTSK
jgi:RNA polymerase sigma-70 factor (ECF subfamily)